MTPRVKRDDDEKPKKPEFKDLPKPEQRRLMLIVQRDDTLKALGDLAKRGLYMSEDLLAIKDWIVGNFFTDELLFDVAWCETREFRRIEHLIWKLSARLSWVDDDGHEYSNYHPRSRNPFDEAIPEFLTMTRERRIETIVERAKERAKR